MRKQLKIVDVAAEKLRFKQPAKKGGNWRYFLGDTSRVAVNSKKYEYFGIIPQTQEIDSGAGWYNHFHHKDGYLISTTPVGLLFAPPQ